MTSIYITSAQPRSRLLELELLQLELEGNVDRIYREIQAIERKTVWSDRIHNAGKITAVVVVLSGAAYLLRKPIMAIAKSIFPKSFFSKQETKSTEALPDVRPESRKTIPLLSRI